MHADASKEEVGGGCKIIGEIFSANHHMKRASAHFLLTNSPIGSSVKT